MIIISVASNEALKEFAEFCKNNERLTVEQIASRRDLTTSSARRYVRACKEKGFLPQDFFTKKQPVSDNPTLESVLAETRDKYADSPPSNNVSGKTVKIAFSDLHLSDEDVMFRSIESTIDRLVDYIGGKDYDSALMLNLGDTISGKGIFRGQETRNVINTSHWQTLVGSVYQNKMKNKILDETSIDSVHFQLVKGNHDEHRNGTNLAYYLARDMQAYGISATYQGNFHISDNLYLLHGWGFSDYRPQSPKFLRSMMKRISNINSQRGGESGEITRVVSGHTHWLDVGLKYNLNLSFDSIGGYQRNKRAELGRVQRPAGMIVYEPDERPYPIEPDKDIFWEEANQENLEFENAGRIYELLNEAYREDPQITT